MFKVEINGNFIWVKSNAVVLEACQYAGSIVPRFCYHENLSIAGNCRMCLVEIGGAPKPVVSCAYPVMNNIKVLVNTPLVKKARENVLEMLLINHPLDCPICDQGGECDLQDQTMVFGLDSSRYFFTKRVVEDKYCGPLIKTIMTRCIHCTRCVRFGQEIAGVDFFGTMNRGNGTEISNYIASFYNSEISGNVIDLCPVGALTSQPYSFKARPWELKSSESIDISDSVGSNIYVEFKESEIVRVIPKSNKEINGNFISDKARFSYDFNSFNRLKSLYLRESDNNGLKKLVKTTWSVMVEHFNRIISQSNNVLFLLGSVDFKILKFFFSLNKMSNFNINVRRLHNLELSRSNVSFYGICSKIKEIDFSNSKYGFVFSSNIRADAAIINLKIRAKFLNTNLKVSSWGLNFQSNYPTQFVNYNLSDLLHFFEGKSFRFSHLFLKAHHPLIFFGENFLSLRLNFYLLFKFLKKMNSSLMVLNICRDFSTESMNFFGLNNVTTRNFLTADSIVLVNIGDSLRSHKFLRRWCTNKNSLYFSSWGSDLAKMSDGVVPISSIYESEFAMLNLEQRPQRSLKVLNTIGDARELSRVLFLLVKDKVFLKKISFCSFLQKIIEDPIIFKDLSPKISCNLHSSLSFSKRLIPNILIKNFLENSYISTNYFVNYSRTMNACSDQQGVSNFFKDVS